MFDAYIVMDVYVPKDRVTNLHQGYGFVEFCSEEDADYAINILNMIKLYGKPIRVNKASQDKKSLDVGANLFVGNLDPDLDEKLLHDTFSAFGVIVINPKIMRDPETGNSQGFGFISYDSFETSDAAIEAMNGQYLCNQQITVSYAYKKDTKGERHGTPAVPCDVLVIGNHLSHPRCLAQPNAQSRTSVKMFSRILVRGSIAWHLIGLRANVDPQASISNLAYRVFYYAYNKLFS